MKVGYNSRSLTIFVAFLAMIIMPTRASANLSEDSLTSVAKFASSLVAQNFNVASTGQFRFVVKVVDAGIRGELAHDTTTILRVTAFPPVVKREVVRSIVDGFLPPKQITSVDIAIDDLNQTDVGDFVAILSTSARNNSVRLTADGVYPIQLSFVRENTTLSSITTFVNFYMSSTSRVRLPVALTATINPSLSLQPNGTTVINDRTRHQLSNVAQALEGAAAPLSVQVTPEILDGLARSSDPADIELLTRLQTALLTHDLLHSTYVSYDPSTAQRSNRVEEFAQQFSWGEQIIDLRNGEKTLAHNVWFSTHQIDGDGVKLLKNIGFRSIVLTPNAAEKIGSLDNYAKPYRVDDAMGFSVADPLYADALSGWHENPISSAYSIAAELLAQRQEILDGGGILGARFIVLSTNTGELADLALLAPLALAIDRAPQLRLRALNSQPAAPEDATRVDLPSTSSTDVADSTFTIEGLQNEVASTSSMLQDSAPQHDLWARSLMVMANDNLSGLEFIAYVKGLRTQLRELRTSVKVPESLNFTLGGKKSDLRIQLRNDAVEDLSVSVEISSTKLQFPSGVRIVTVPANSAIDMVVPVVARARGRFPIVITLKTPDGKTQVGQPVHLEARVAAVTGLGQVVSGAALLVLLSWR